MINTHELDSPVELWCLVVVVWLFLAVPWVCLRFVIVVFPDQTHLLFLLNENIFDTHYLLRLEERHCTFLFKVKKQIW